MVYLVIETDVRVHLLIYINNCGIKRKRSEKGPKPQLFRQRFFVVLRCLKKSSLNVSIVLQTKDKVNHNFEARSCAPKISYFVIHQLKDSNNNHFFA